MTELYQQVQLMGPTNLYVSSEILEPYLMIIGNIQVQMVLVTILGVIVLTEMGLAQEVQHLVSSEPNKCPVLFYQRVQELWVSQEH
jgi:hypothetical protein